MDVNRRSLLKTAVVGAAWAVSAPDVAFAQWPPLTPGSDDVLGRAEERIEKHRKGTTLLRLLVPDGQALPAGVDLRIRQTKHQFLFGCNIFKLGRCRTPADSGAYAGGFARLLNFATLPFYWWSYERQKGRPMDDRTEEIVRWCKDHDVTTKGHPLAWNYVDPPWLNGTPEEVMRLQIERIARCVERFEGDIAIWDVVNEATHYDREQLKRDAPKLTEAIARMGVGEYVRTAFRTARQANPKARLIINDYRTDAAFADNVISQLVDTEGKPLYDIIGIQSHMHGGYWGAAKAWSICERFARFGKPLHFTETTVLSGQKRGSDWPTTPEGEQQQAQQAAEFYTVLFSHPAVEAITWWDFTDQDAWQQAPAGLVRSDMSPKPAYERLRELIKGKWWTDVEVRTGEQAALRFQGFLGHYEVQASLAARRLAGRFVLDRGPETTIDVRLA
ncbi:MAG TPA: endo-1,4-beta-xylanase [Sedimentisphaerales bacterium]|jgi:GH35 family endo-1,4-beta-xylanase|nr:endo-1,4-beta-xylanase [Sedimentisphaerales bacterium]HNU31537.1 endo-1,4-beta-xylanase [Sedimentisphaerales bacterium]